MLHVDDEALQLRIDRLKGDLTELRSLIDSLEHTRSIGEAYRGAIEVVDRASAYEGALLELIEIIVSMIEANSQKCEKTMNEGLSEARREYESRVLALESRISTLEERSGHHS